MSKTAPADRQKKDRKIVKCPGSVTLLAGCIALLCFALPYTAIAQNDADAISKLADSLAGTGDYAAAISLYGKLIQKKADPEYYHSRGNNYKEIREYDKSIADISKAISLAPDSCKYYLSKGIAQEAADKADDALATYTQGLKHADDDSTRSVFTGARGVIFFKRHNLPQATEELTKTLKYDSTNYDALVDLASIYNSTHHAGDAMTMLAAAMRHYPDDVAVIGNLAYLYMTAGEFAASLELNNRVLELSDQKPPEVLNNRGYVKYMLNDLPGALADINASLTIAPGNAFAWKNRALVYIGMNKSELACADLREAIKQGYTATYGDDAERLLKDNCK